MEAAWFEDLLACPDCLSSPFVPGRRCAGCGFLSKTARDLRASGYDRRGPVVTRPSPPVDAEAMLRRIDTSRPRPVSDMVVAGRDSREFLSVLRNRFVRGAAVLDLGCGPRDQEPALTAMGHRYIGIDYSGDASDLLADGHALPFRNQSFDVVFSFAVLEHLHSPARALAEIARVLKPGGIYIGSVSQGEPFHASYFHFTPWGLVAALGQVDGLTLVRLWPSEDTLRSVASMGRYPRVIRLLIGLVDWLHRMAPWLAPRRLNWPEKEKEIDCLYRAGSLCFHVERGL